MIPTPANRREAVRFIAALTGHEETPCTWQTFSDAGKDWRQARVLHGPIREVGCTLIDANAEGCGVFVTVNATDLQGRKAGNVVAVRALFADFDGPEPSAWHIEPSIVVRSAHGPHAYWLVDDCPLDAFTEAQARIAAFYGSDPKVKDLPRVMRVPGFYHRKGEPQMVTLERCERRRYSLRDALADIPELPKAAPRPVAPRIPGRTGGRGPIDWPAIDAVAEFMQAGLYGRPMSQGKHSVVCPWANGHTKVDLTGLDTSTVIWERGDSGAAVFHCAHRHCEGKRLYDALMEIGADLPRMKLRNEAQPPAKRYEK